MTEHLPECWVTDPSNPPAWCICFSLRACEARVREDERSNNFTPDDFSDGMTGTYRRGLDAARGVVTEQSRNRSGSDGSPAMYVWVPYLLAAIDALKEER